MNVRAFQVDVDGVGKFTFRRRGMRDWVAVPNKAMEILGGVPHHSWLMERATMLAILELRTVSAPDGWVLSDMDPLDEADQELVIKVYGRLMEEEARFRGGPAEKRAGDGPGVKQNDGDVVPAPLPPSPD